MAGPIGIFDSGYGGLTVLEDIQKRLPQYDYLYLGDNARAPYGTRSFEVIYEYTLQAVQELFDRGCHLVILACNTASAKALRTIQQNDLQRIAPGKKVLGVIRPSTELIGNYSKTKNIGVLATEGTVSSQSYLIEIHKFFPDCRVYQHACPIWVPLIENNEHQTDEGRAFIKQDIQKLLQQSSEIDTILLGCTHYPLILNEIEAIVPDHIKVIAQGEIIANSLADYLERHVEIEGKCSKNGTIRFLTSENTEIFDHNATLYTSFDVASDYVDLSKR
ncbi:MAG: glutamate racemase [Crocinitomicaceae bacterium]